MIQERYYKLGEIQAMLGVSRSTVWRWTAEQGLKVVRVGNVTRIRESDLQNFLDRHVGATVRNSSEGGGLEPREETEMPT